MVILIAGESHTGKTLLAQRLLERYGFPYLSIDHLKMGLIRSGQTPLTPTDDPQLLEYLWPIVKEMIKTAIENQQNLIVEGCYISFDYKKDFAPTYLEQIQYVCLIFSEGYIRNHLDSIVGYENVIERRQPDPDWDISAMVQSNAIALQRCQELGNPYILIDSHYQVDYTPQGLE